MSIYTNIKLKRVYEQPCESDGIRLLADRLWPRGVSKKSLDYDEWIKDLCPSNSLRKAWHQRNINYHEFCDSYRNELSMQKSKIERIATLAQDTPVTLLSAIKSLSESHLSVLRVTIIEAIEESHPKDDARASDVCYSKLNQE